MHGVSTRRPQRGCERSSREGFSLLEMMTVIAVALIIASIAMPIYINSVRRTRGAVLRDHLYTMRTLIDRFTLDNGRAPLRLEELVDKGYLGRLPTDPFTGSNETWRETKEDEPLPTDSRSWVGIMGPGTEALTENPIPLKFTPQQAQRLQTHCTELQGSRPGAASVYPRESLSGFSPDVFSQILALTGIGEGTPSSEEAGEGCTSDDPADCTYD